MRTQVFFSMILMSMLTLVLATCTKDKGKGNDGRSVEFITADGKITGGEIFTYKDKVIPTSLHYKIHYHLGGNFISTETYPYNNKSFTMTLPIPTSDQLTDIAFYFNYEDAVITPSDVKIGTGGVKGVWLMNVALKNLNNDNYRFKKGDGYIPEFFYADKACTITGSEFKNFRLRQGWNMIVKIFAEDVTDTSEVYYFTADVPAGFYWITEP